MKNRYVQENALADIEAFFKFLFLHLRCHNSQVAQLLNFSERQIYHWSIEQGQITVDETETIHVFTFSSVIKVYLIKICLESSYSLQESFTHANFFLSYFGLDDLGNKDPVITKKPVPQEFSRSVLLTLGEEGIITTVKAHLIERLRLSPGEMERMGLSTKRIVDRFLEFSIIDSAEENPKGLVTGKLEPRNKATVDFQGALWCFLVEKNLGRRLPYIHVRRFLSERKTELANAAKIIVEHYGKIRSVPTLIDFELTSFSQIAAFIGNAVKMINSSLSGPRKALLGYILGNYVFGSEPYIATRSFRARLQDDLKWLVHERCLVLNNSGRNTYQLNPDPPEKEAVRCTTQSIRCFFLLHVFLSGEFPLLNEISEDAIWGRMLQALFSLTNARVLDAVGGGVFDFRLRFSEAVAARFCRLFKSQAGTVEAKKG